MSPEGGAFLLRRLRELSLVEPGAVLAGAPAESHERVLAALADDLHDALREARRRSEELSRRIGRGPEPLAALDAPDAARTAGGGAAFVDRVCSAALARADACRELAQLDSAAALVVPRLSDVERLLVGLRRG